MERPFSSVASAVQTAQYLSHTLDKVELKVSITQGVCYLEILLSIPGEARVSIVGEGLRSDMH